ncbi:DUF3325 domain-containing protein [Stenotrophomonas sp. MMGLT7]|uniref:DUF3325 domain-containing protein n=1 Tax=Stenotrophomonas sp. MMGLT7 TaxID=2901227 RepID=UPI001E5814AE|nr:DUF3325 domain-containing protein [Stenotrophomonas sp. MMGLT7]MCD7099628.1 DUF3325 domain-containing protein [Stenotrophomonas sp. MMGLT7]
MSWAMLGLCFSGFAALCLAMEKHQLELYGKDRASPQRMRLWRALGWTLLAAAFALAVLADGWNIGPVAWLGGLTVAGALLGLGLLPYRPGALVPVAWSAPVLGLLGWWLGR